MKILCQLCLYIYFLGIVEEEHISPDYNEITKKRKEDIRGIRKADQNPVQQSAEVLAPTPVEDPVVMSDAPIPSLVSVAVPLPQDDVELNLFLEDSCMFEALGECDAACCIGRNGNVVIPDINNSFSEEAFMDLDDLGRVVLPTRPHTVVKPPGPTPDEALTEPPEPMESELWESSEPLQMQPSEPMESEPMESPEPEPFELSEPNEQMELDLELEERPQETVQVASTSNPALPLSTMMAAALG